MTFSVSRVPNESVDLVFDRLSRQIERALNHGAGDATTLPQFREAVKRGDMLAWVVHRETDIIAVIMLSVRRYDAKTTLFVEVAAGRDMDSWIDEIESLLREYKALVGADTIETLCRDGMAKKLSSRWKRKATLLELR